MLVLLENHQLFLDIIRHSVNCELSCLETVKTLLTQVKLFLVDETQPRVVRVTGCRCPVWPVYTEDVPSHYRDNRPGLHAGHRLPDSRVLLHVYRAIDGPVPYRGLVGPVDHVYLDLYSPGQDLVASILGYGLQPIALSLEVITVLEC